MSISLVPAVRALVFDAPIEGAVTMDGSEKTVVLDEMEGNPPRYLEGYIDLSQLESGDRLLIRYYIKAESNGYKEYFRREYSGRQPTQLLYAATKPTKYGIKITAQQTAGATFKTLAYQFFRRRTF
jgi:hypothetical protein